MATIADKGAAAPLPGGSGTQASAEGGIDSSQSPAPGIESAPTVIDASPPVTSSPAMQGSLPPRFAEGRQIGSRYRVIRQLGEGGMGAVYLVHDSELNRDVALKLIRPSLAESSRRPDREQRYIRAAETYFLRRYDDAIRAYREIIAAYPYEMEARHLLAFCLMDNRQPKDAIEPLKFIARMEPEMHSTWSMLGMAYLESRNLNEAVTALRRYVELEPDSANAHHTLADAYRAQGEFDLAAEEYNKAIAADPAFYFSQVSLGVLDVLRGRLGEAEKRLEAVLTDTRAEARHRIEAALGLASLRRAQGRFRDSVRPLERMQREIEKESIREALALSLHGAGNPRHRHGS